MATKQPTPWQLSADEVLAVVLHDGQAYERARFEWLVDERHFPPGAHRDVFRAVDDMRLKNAPIHVTAVHDACNGKVDIAWLGGLFMLYSEGITGEVFRQNVLNMKGRAQAYMDIQAMTWAIEALKNASTVDERQRVVGEVITALGTEAHAEMKPATALEAGERFEALMAAPPAKMLPTGIRWLDNLTGGIQHGQIWWIAAAYKKRKSTLMRNMAIHAARAGASVTVGALEGSQSLLIAQMVAMFAAEWMIKHGHYNEKDRHGLLLNGISAALLLRLRQRYRTDLDKRQVAAIDYGLLEYKRLGDNLRIYDKSPANGGLGTMASLETMINRDIKKHGVDLVFVDYMQLIDGGRGTIYENVSHISQRLQHLAAANNIAVIPLAQLNEESVKGGGDSHSPGVKGGGDPAATADFLLTTDYTNDEDREPIPDRLRVTLKLARHGIMGKYTDLTIHPASGWIVPTEAVDAPDAAPAPLDLGGAP